MWCMPVVLDCAVACAPVCFLTVSHCTVAPGLHHPPRTPNDMERAASSLTPEPQRRPCIPGGAEHAAVAPAAAPPLSWLSAAPLLQGHDCNKRHAGHHYHARNQGHGPAAVSHGCASGLFVRAATVLPRLQGRCRSRTSVRPASQSRSRTTSWRSNSTGSPSRGSLW